MNHQHNNQPVHTVCRCCNQKSLDAITQTALYPGASTVTLVTCWNDGCAMNGVTWDNPTYGDLDLSLYGANQHPAYQAGVR